MTRAPEAARPQNAARWKLVPEITALPLVFLAIVVPFLRFYQYDLLLPESLILIAGAIAAGAIASALRWLRPNVLGPVATAIVLCIYAGYQSAFTDRLLGWAGAIAQAIGSGAVALALAVLCLFLAVLLVCWLLREHLASIVAAIFGTIVASSLALPPPAGGAITETGSLPAGIRDLPPVIHIILDEHIGPAALPWELDESVAAAREIRNTYKDFALYERAYSRFSETHYSLASLMNNERGEDVMELLSQKQIGHTLLRSTWFDQLKQQGYALKVYQTDWLDMCGQLNSVDACYTYPLYSLNSVQRSPLSTAARLKALLGKLQLAKEPGLAAPLAAGQTLERFQSDIEKVPRGVAYVVHLLLPHYGYLFRADCSLTEPQEWQDQPVDKTVVYTPEQRLQTYSLYLPQVICTQRRIAGLFRHLRKLGIYDGATIVVHGDHGSRIGQRTIHVDAEAMSERDLLDHHSTLLAIKSAGVAAGPRQESVSLQHVFSTTFLGGSENALSPPGEVLIRNETAGTFSQRTLVWPAGTDSGGGSSVAVRAFGATVTSQ